MKRVVIFFSISCAGVALALPDTFHTRVGDDILVQKASVKIGSPLYEWKPGDSICPLHATNAITLATQAMTNISNSINILPSQTKIMLLPSDRGDGWYYRITFRVRPPGESRRSITLNVAVHLDGTVPDIEKGSLEELKEKYAWLEKMYCHEKDQSRLRQNLRQYQMEVIRTGMAPLPIPMTEGMDDQLETEGGLLPTNDTTNSTSRRFENGFRSGPSPEKLTPEEQAKKRAEVRAYLRVAQMKLICDGKPLLPVGVGALTEAQRKQLESEGIVFLQDGSISNSISGFCHPPRPPANIPCSN